MRVKILQSSEPKFLFIGAAMGITILVTIFFIERGNFYGKLIPGLILALLAFSLLWYQYNVIKALEKGEITKEEIEAVLKDKVVARLPRAGINFTTFFSDLIAKLPTVTEEDKRIREIAPDLRPQIIESLRDDGYVNEYFDAATAMHLYNLTD